MTGEPPIPPTDPEEPSSFRPSWTPPPETPPPGPLALGCMGIGAFLASIVGFTFVGLASGPSPVWGFLITLAIAGIAIGSFIHRQKRGPAPLLGAAVAGLAIAAALFGLCYASMSNFRIQ